jgi:guanine deaminase
VFFGQDLEATSKIGFSDAFQYEAFSKPYDKGGIKITQFRADLGAVPYQAWMDKSDKHPY